MFWQLINSGSALGAAFVVGSIVGAGATVWMTVKAVEFVIAMCRS